MFRQRRENGIHKPIHKLLITVPGSTRQTVASKPIKIAHKYRQDPGYVKYSEIDIWNIPSDKMSGLRCLETCQSRKLYLFEIFGGSLEVLNLAFYGCTLLATFIGCFGNVLGAAPGSGHDILPGLMQWAMRSFRNRSPLYFEIIY